MISVDEAHRRLVEAARPIRRTVCVPLREAAGRVLAEDVLATRTQPGFDASAMDGYALQATDCQAPFQPLMVIGESAAGRGFDGAVGPGEAVRIFTGAPLPQGADAVLIQEDAERRDDGSLLPQEAVTKGQHVRPAGIDFAAGRRLLETGLRLSPGAVALAASGGHPQLRVLDRPKVAVLATGDELVEPGAAIGPSQIIASNGYGVAALVEAAGGTIIDCGIARDREDEIASHLDRALAEGCDCFVTIGGASVGDHDLIGKVFAARKVDIAFLKVAMRPGKPLMAGRIGDMRLVGLPGNPASSMVAATLFLAPLVRRLAGRPDRPLTRAAILGADVPANGQRTDFMRSLATTRDDGTIVVTPLPRQDSSLLSIYAAANALLMRAPDAQSARAGAPCRIIDLA
ncbi:molybdopterin molybdotransferase MoeA [Jiella sp. MQZ9-1]|uniref:Molybdopterin molybdenumtransferase n=1 Tax=Jiella flava TaxID=2816857 RepID=A0A939FVQ5_9HYPH|nr:gephyrin-like molybdotransferase Glp [Jiella flava]MBO0661045.1 molybdopterin molybdotransferase MoeA [Jiella flava]MCD2469692.1 molybdopterin molybdotransferase MoeA [Jiella flava]